MSAISNFLTFLRSAIYAIDVRDGIADAIEQCYNDVNNPTLKTEALEAALQTKIDEGEMAALTIGDGTITAAKLASGVIDNTLATSGAAADAKKTGDEIAAVKADLEALESGGLSIKDSVKQALLACFAGVSFEDSNGQALRTALYNALYETAILSISVVFNPGNSIIPIGADIETLRQYLTVTVHYDDASTGTVTAYTLSGTIESGTSTITVSYEGLTTTFTVTTNAWLFGNIVRGTATSTHEDKIYISTQSNRACTSTYLSLNSGDVVGFYNDSDYETYKFAIAPRSGDAVDWSATGGTSGYVTSDFTLTVTSDYYYALITRADNGEIDSTQIEYLNESFGVKE